MAVVDLTSVASGSLVELPAVPTDLHDSFAYMAVVVLSSVVDEPDVVVWTGWSGVSVAASE